MSRENVRNWKRLLHVATDGGDADSLAIAKDCALALLDRSIAFGHGRLAVLRLVTAVRSGADITPEAWKYCTHVSQVSRDEDLRRLFAAAYDEYHKVAAQACQVAEVRHANHCEHHSDG